MRILVLACFLLNLLTGHPVHALEIEEQKRFSGISSGQTLSILSTADLAVFAPIIEAFRARNPTVDVHYVVTGSSDVFREISDGSVDYDLVISSAMDLQIKLVNDGLAQDYESGATQRIPHWAQWGGQLFAFTQEPVVLLVSRNGLAPHPVPRTRQDLLRMVRQAPERFRGRIGTYDLRRSGLGYMLATQDIRRAETFWQMAEVLGGLDARLYCCSGDMIDDILSGELLVAYNVLGSYADARLIENHDVEVILLDDYTHVMLRTLLIPATAQRPDLAGVFIDYLLAPDVRSTIRNAGLPPLDENALSEIDSTTPIPLGPSLLVYLDQLKKRSTLRAWEDSIRQGRP